MFEDIIGEKTEELETMISGTNHTGCPQCGSYDIQVYPHDTTQALFCYCFCIKCGHRWTFDV